MRKALLGRSEELKELKTFARSKKAGFVYIRGRRRVGKSSLLMELQRSSSRDVFYFFGTPDSSTQGVLSSFAEEWDKFTGKPHLSELKYLSWEKIFTEISNYSRQKKKKAVLIFDEIQWIAKTKSGCIGALKHAWLEWERLGIKVIICGSSNRFFLKNTGGEETILRGMKSRSDIWIHPFSLSQVKKFYFPDWKNEEVALAYMMLGGIPYYLNRIEKVDRGFIQSLNDALFVKNTIFLEEINEVLRLEFNEHGLKTAKLILGALGQDGRTQGDVQKTTGLPLTTVARALEALCDYGIVFQKSSAHRKKQNDAGIRYFMKDFYLNFYFQVLLPFATKIENNTSKGLLFSQVFENSNMNYFIPNFSGKAFELLVRYSLERRTALKLNKLLFLKDYDYDVLDYWDRETQIDLLVEHSKDRLSRLIECKWISAQNKDGSSYLDEVFEKQYIPPNKTYSLKRYLMLSKEPSESLLNKAKEKDIRVIGLNSLI